MYLVHPLFFLSMPAQYGLIGYPLSHSFSPAYFAAKFAQQGIDAVYDLYPLEDVKELHALVQNTPGLKGLNVTIPYKESVIPLLDELDADAKAIGAVNCIKIENGKTTGYNTDAIGFEESLKPLLRPQHSHALVLGTGGASLAVVTVLKKLGINWRYVSRAKQDGSYTYDELNADILSQYKLIINTTPLGMSPNTDTCPALPYEAIGRDHLLYDLVYNPAETLFLSKGKPQGAAIKNGLEMLELQADASWRIWNS